MGRHRTCSSLVVIFAFPPRLLMLTVCLGTLWLSVGGAGVTDSFSPTATQQPWCTPGLSTWAYAGRGLEPRPASFQFSTDGLLFRLHVQLHTLWLYSHVRVSVKDFSVNYNCFSSSGSHGFSLPKPHQRRVRRVVEAKRELTTFFFLLGQPRISL